MSNSVDWIKKESASNPEVKAKMQDWFMSDINQTITAIRRRLPPDAALSYQNGKFTLIRQSTEKNTDVIMSAGVIIPVEEHARMGLPEGLSVDGLNEKLGSLKVLGATGQEVIDAIVGPELNPAGVEQPNITRSDKGGTGTGFVGVSEAGAGYTVVETADGTFERRTGTRAWRNNNPGNIEYGEFAKSRGSIGTDGRFAVFATYEDGRNAKRSLLWDTKGYAGKTIAEAINRYAPPSENNTNAYIAQVAASLGVPATTSMASLNPGQREIMLDAMERIEGFRPGQINGVDAPTREPSIRGNVVTPITESPFNDTPTSTPRPDATMASGAPERRPTGPLAPLATPALEEDTRAYLESIGALKEQAKQTVANKPMDADVKALIEQLTAALEGK
jgi:hypothetical protein